MTDLGSSFEDRDPSLACMPYSYSLPYLSLEHDNDGLQLPGQIPSMYLPIPGCSGRYVDVPIKKHIRPRYEGDSLRISEENELKMNEKRLEE